MLLIDDSDDNTKEIAASFRNVMVVDGPGRGIAAAYLKGFMMLRDPMQRDYVIQMDAGWSHDPADIPKLLDAPGDLVLGTRQFEVKGWRSLLSMAAGAMMGVDDATCGFRRWSTRLLKRVPLYQVRSKGFAFQLEMLTLARMMNARIYQVPIEYRLTNSTLRPWMIAEAIYRYFEWSMFLC